MQNIIRLQPVFKEKIWGGKKLKDIYGYDIPSDKTGECWAISAHKEGDCNILNDEFKGETLSSLYKEHRELFGNIQDKEFPLLAKILDASDNLSIQVHPNDEFARTVEKQEFGKTEAWYVLDCNEDTVLEIGHTAKTKDELVNRIKNGEWDKFLNYRNIKKGDYFFIPSGTVHAICENTLIYEIQQSSDTTYRLYDYDRVDDNGNKRELHIDRSIEVIEVPQENTPVVPKEESGEGYKKTTFVESKYFTSFRYSIDGKAEINEKAPFILCTVVDGSGKIGDEAIKKGDNFIIPSGYKQIVFDGKVEILMATI